MDTIAERVARGVALLDLKAPGWDDRINVAELNIASCHVCICGQVFGSYSGGIRVLGIDWNADNDYMYRSPVEYGFTGGPLVTEAWRDVIARRRLAKMPTERVLVAVYGGSDPT